MLVLLAPVLRRGSSVSNASETSILTGFWACPKAAILLPRGINSANVPDDLLPLAFGTKGCSAADVPKVPKAWELSASACSHFLL